MTTIDIFTLIGLMVTGGVGIYLVWLIFYKFLYGLLCISHMWTYLNDRDEDFFPEYKKRSVTIDSKFAALMILAFLILGLCLLGFLLEYFKIVDFGILKIPKRH